MPKKKTRSRRRSAPRRKTRRGPKSINLLDTATGLFAIATIAAPYATGGTGSALQSGNVRNVPQAFMADSKQALSAQNVLVAVTPFFVAKLVRMGASAVGARPPKVGRIKAF